MPTEKPSDLNCLLQPRSIALVGAKDRSVWSVSAFENLKRGGFEGDIHLINPKGGTIHGMEAHTSCAAVGAKIDVALLMVPESVLLDTFDDLQSAGVQAAVILSAGFAEAGEEGQKKQQAMTEKARAAGTKLLRFRQLFAKNGRLDHSSAPRSTIAGSGTGFPKWRAG